MNALYLHIAWDLSQKCNAVREKLSEVVLRVWDMFKRPNGFREIFPSTLMDKYVFQGNPESKLQEHAAG